MNWLHRFFPWLFTPLSPVQRYGDPQIDILDTEFLAKEIGLEEEAKQLGKANLPASDEKVLTGIETRILRRVERAKQDYLAWGVDRLNVYNQDIERHDIHPILNKAEQVDREFERLASTLLAERAHVLSELATSARATQKEYELFKARHGLLRHPTYPDGAGVFFRSSILVLLVIVEGGLNAFLFAKGLTTGWVGGFVYAGMLAFVNVTFAFAFSRWAIPYWNHYNIVCKLLGFLSIFLFFVTTVGIALLIAHFREALASDLPDAPRFAVESLRNHPFVLTEIHSWVLLGVSILFAFIACIDGYTLDDPYPGYGRVNRRWKEAQEAYLLELEEMRVILQTLKNETLIDLERMVTEAKTSLNRLHESIERKAALCLRLRNALTDVDHCRDSLLRQFRDINRQYRTTPCPLYFSEHLVATQLYEPDFSLDENKHKYGVQCERLASFIVQIERLRGAIQSSFVRHRDGLKPLDYQFDHREPTG